jgi:adenylate kinase family enzyme
VRRIVVVGTSGSGKTTMTRALSQRLGVPHLELDAINWGPGWTQAPRDVFRAQVDAATDAAAWACDGNYSSVRHLVWTKADTLVWLDYPMTVVFPRVVRRTLRRTFTGEELWNGNRERLWTQLCTRDSLLLWVLTTWRKHRRNYPKLIASDAYRHLRVYRFRHPSEAERWLGTVRSCDLSPFGQQTDRNAEPAS